MKIKKAIHQSIYFLSLIVFFSCNQSHSPVFDCKDFNCNLLANGNTPIFGVPNQKKLSFIEIQEQGYWYSRYNLSALVMKSGLGTTFTPNPSIVKSMVKMVSDQKSKAIPPINSALIKKIYNTGTPKYKFKNNGVMNDFKNYRWENKISHAPTSTSAFGWTLIKEVEWSKLFNNDLHFGLPGQNDIAGAQQRFAGLALCVESIMQTDLFITDYSKTRKEFNYNDRSGMFVAFAAISNLANFINTQKKLPLMSNNRCSNTVTMMKNKPAAEVAQEYLTFLEDFDLDLPEAKTIKEKSLLIQGYSFYAKALNDKNIFIENAIDTTDELIILKPKNIIEQSYIIRSTMTTYRITKDQKYLNSALEHWNQLFKNFDLVNYKFTSLNKYLVSDVAVILSALNALKLYAGKNVNQYNVLFVFINFFKTIMNTAKLQISAPKITSISPWERRANSEFHRSIKLPFPLDAGGRLGTAPVFARSVEFISKNNWKNDQTIFDTSGAMNLANQMIWFHSSEVEGIPCPDSNCINAMDINPDDLQPPKKPGTNNPDDGNPNEVPLLSFNQIHKKILMRCIGCHAGSGAPHGLDMSTPDKAFKNLVNVNSVEGRNFGGVKRVLPGNSDPSKSYIIGKLQKIKNNRIGGRMPFGGPYLNESEIKLVKAWIDNGAQR